MWNELEKENKEFFQTYYTQAQTEAPDRLSEAETDEVIQKMISDSSSKDGQDSVDSSEKPHSSWIITIIYSMENDLRLFPTSSRTFVY